MTDEQAISTALGVHLHKFAALLSILAIDSDGGRLVIGRTAADMTWLSWKLQHDQYIAHVPKHRMKDANDELDEIIATAEKLKQLLQQ